MDCHAFTLSTTGNCTLLSRAPSQPTQPTTQTPATSAATLTGRDTYSPSTAAVSCFKHLLTWDLFGAAVAEVEGVAAGLGSGYRCLRDQVGVRGMPAVGPVWGAPTASLGGMCCVKGCLGCLRDWVCDGCACGTPGVQLLRLGCLWNRVVVAGVPAVQLGYNCSAWDACWARCGSMN